MSEVVRAGYYGNFLLAGDRLVRNDKSSDSTNVVIGDATPNASDTPFPLPGPAGGSFLTLATKDQIVTTGGQSNALQAFVVDATKKTLTTTIDFTSIHPSAVAGFSAIVGNYLYTYSSYNFRVSRINLAPGSAWETVADEGGDWLGVAGDDTGFYVLSAPTYQMVTLRRYTPDGKVLVIAQRPTDGDSVGSVVLGRDRVYGFTRPKTAQGCLSEGDLWSSRKDGSDLRVVYAGHAAALVAGDDRSLIITRCSSAGSALPDYFVLPSSGGRDPVQLTSDQPRDGTAVLYGGYVYFAGNSLKRVCRLL